MFLTRPSERKRALRGLGLRLGPAAFVPRARSGRQRRVRYRGRFAPSPTGALHLGSAAAALVTAVRARAMGGALVLRIEDLDRARVVPGAILRLQDELAWLGLAFDEGPRRGGPCGPYVQSERRALYDAALELLGARGLTYLCDCSRAEIARASSAPHAGDEGPRYPGTCRPHGLEPRAFRRPPAVRLAVPAGREVVIDDVVRGPVREVPADTVADFVLRRGDGEHAYQLACVVDDLAMGITEVVRGADLASSAGRQVLLAELLGAPRAPRFLHVPLLVGESGARLAKRAESVPLAEHRALGRSAEALVRALALAYGLAAPGEPTTLDALAERFDARVLDVPTVPLARVLEQL